MNPAILLYLGQFMQVLQALPTLIAAGQNVAGIINQGRDAIAAMAAANRPPTAEEWAALDATTDNLRKQLHAA